MLLLFLFQEVKYVPSPISLYIEDLKQKSFVMYLGISKYRGHIYRGLPVLQLLNDCWVAFCSNSYETLLETDASGYSIDGVLIQETPGQIINRHLFNFPQQR